MSNQNDKNTKYIKRPFGDRVVDFLAAISLILFTLRLCGVIDIPIWKAFIPVAVPYAVGTLSALLAGIAGLINGSINSHKE